MIKLIKNDCPSVTRDNTSDWCDVRLTGDAQSDALQYMASVFSYIFLRSSLATDLTEKACHLENDTLLIPSRKGAARGEAGAERRARPTRKLTDRKGSRSSKGSWAKGFLSPGTSSKPKDEASHVHDAATVKTVRNEAAPFGTCCSCTTMVHYLWMGGRGGGGEGGAY